MNKAVQSLLFETPTLKHYNYRHNSTLKQITNTQSKHQHPCYQFPNKFKKQNINTTANSNHQYNNEQNQQQTTERLLTYSNTTQFTSLQDYTTQLTKILYLMSSKQNIKNHTSHSLSLHGYNETMSAEIGNILSRSFIQYIEIAKSLNTKLIKGQIILVNSEKQKVKDVDDVKFKNQGKNLQSHAEKMMDSLMKQIESQFSKIIQKTIVFQSQIYLKLGKFQDSLIKVTMLRNDLLQDRINDNLWQQNCRKYQFQNKKLKVLLKEKEILIDQYVLRQKKMQISSKDQQVRNLKRMLKDVRNQLEEQKLLYDKMIEKNLNLQKQLYLLSNGQNKSEKQSQSFQIIERSQIHFLAQSCFTSIPTQSII